MRLKQELTVKKDENQKRAIAAHLGFITCVMGKVEKIGIAKVLAMRADDNPMHKDFWVKSAYKRVLEFAENSQYKMQPTRLEGPGEDGEFLLKIECDYGNDNKATQEPSNRISEYVKIQGSSNR